jgi:hypothetical protein
MHRPDQMEYGNLGWKVTGTDKITMFQTAFLAKTNRADVPTPVTLDALLKLIDPPLETFLLVIGFHFLKVHVVVHAHLLFIRS